MVIAIIDSGVNKEEIPFEEKKIRCVKYVENEGWIQDERNVVNEHGTEIASILCREATENTEILSLKVLGENNRCSMQTLLHALDYCLQARVDIINMSLGYAGNDENNIRQLRKRCDEASRLGIMIVAAFSNEENKISYPAAFDNVIAVRTKESSSELVSINGKDNEFIFSQDFVAVTYKERFTCRKGTSFLVPLVVGWVTQYLQSIRKEHSTFMQMMAQFIQDKIDGHIYVNRLLNEEEKLMKEKNTFFFCGRIDKNNQSIFQYFDGLNYKITLGREEIIHKSKAQLLSFAEQYDILYIGVLDVNYVKQHFNHLQNLIYAFGIGGKTVLSVFPVMNTYERVKMVRELHCDIKTIYK